MLAQFKSVFAPRSLFARLTAASIVSVFLLSPIVRAEDDLLAPSGTSEMSNDASMPTQDPNMPPANDASAPPAADYSGTSASEEPAPARPAKKAKKNAKKKKAGKKAKKSAKKNAKKKKKKHNYS